jgi:hypothetical protein
MSDTSGQTAGPFEEQRRVYDLLSQETRHLILQNVLGHPEHLPSLAELDHMIPKSTGAISDQLDTLAASEILTEYDHEPNVDKRDLPSQFYGLTEKGVKILFEYNYLRGLPIAQAVYRNTRTPERIERHESAPRPELPEAVSEALTYEKSTTDTPLVERLREQHSEHPSLTDQIKVLEALSDRNVGPDDDGIAQTEGEELIEDDLDYRTGMLLDTLSETELVERFKPSGPSTFVINEASDEIVNGRVRKAAEENLSALVDHLDSEIYATPASTESGIAVADGAGETVRHVLADEFDVPQSKVAETLHTGDPVEKVNDAVKAIKESESVESRDEYGQLLFVDTAYRYRLTKTAMRLLER